MNTEINHQFIKLRSFTEELVRTSPSLTWVLEEFDILETLVKQELEVTDRLPQSAGRCIP